MWNIWMLKKLVNILQWPLDIHGSQNIAVSSMLIRKKNRQTQNINVTASEAWIICVHAVTKHNGTSEVLWDAAGSRTQVHVPKAGGLDCKEMKHREEVRCQRLVLLTLLQWSVIHETAPFTPLSFPVGGVQATSRKRSPRPFYLLCCVDHHWASGICDLLPLSCHLDTGLTNSSGQMLHKKMTLPSFSSPEIYSKQYSFQ